MASKSIKAAENVYDIHMMVSIGHLPAREYRYRYIKVDRLLPILTLSVAFGQYLYGGLGIGKLLFF
jgi:hypothetical protein